MGKGQAGQGLGNNLSVLTLVFENRKLSVILKQGLDLINLYFERN